MTGKASILINGDTLHGILTYSNFVKSMVSFNYYYIKQKNLKNLKFKKNQFELLGIIY